jgi:two-component system cell cycle sensor histidine kinase/response regulator CckA
VITFAARALTLNREEALPWSPLVEGHCVEIVVRDTGPGMSEEVRAHALEPFFTTKRVGEGTGLGLSSVYGAVQNMGGAMRIETAAPHGAVIRLRFPLGTLAVSLRTPATPNAAPAPQRTLLFVEHDDAVRSVMLRMLRAAGHHVAEARNGQEALDLAQAMGEELAGVISDVRMPGMSGIDMVRALRNVRPGVPVLFVSGNADASWIEEFGASTILITKPFASARLLTALEQVLAT